MTELELNNTLEAFSKKTVLLIGDGMIDAYMWGAINRQSPEAPVSVVDVYEQEKRLGGAANVAKNLHALGAKTVLCSFVGDDENGAVFNHLMDRNELSIEGLFTIKNRPTTVKTRIIAHDKHVLRVDEEVTAYLPDYSEFINHVKQLFGKHQFDVVLLQDYNKGVLAPQVISAVIGEARRLNIPTVVDPKKKSFFDFKNVTLFKPNLKEIKEGLNRDFNELDAHERCENVKLLRERLSAEMVLLTLSEHGVYIQDENGADVLLPAFKRNIVDVSGAGDTVVSVAALAVACGCCPQDIAFLSNLAGGLVCEEVGVVPINRHLLISEAQRIL